MGFMDMNVCPNEECQKEILNKDQTTCPECGTAAVSMRVGSKEAIALFKTKKEKGPQKPKVGEGPWADVLRKNITYPEFSHGHQMAINCPNANKCMAITTAVPSVTFHQTCSICMMLQQLIVINKEKTVSAPGTS